MTPRERRAPRRSCLAAAAAAAWLSLPSGSPLLCAGGPAPRRARRSAPRAAAAAERQDGASDFWAEAEAHLEGLGVRRGGDEEGMGRFWRFFDRGASDEDLPAEYRTPGYEPLGLFYPGLRTFGPGEGTAPVPFVPLEAFGELPEVLRAHAEAVRAEAARLPPEAWEPQPGQKGWGMLTLRELGKPTREWRAYSRQLPGTLALLRELDAAGWLAPESVKLLRQAPGTGLSPHSDGLNMVLPCHLGLEVPGGPAADAAGALAPWIECGAVRRHWVRGEGLVFDQTFVHSTWNPALGDRLVLAMDLWHHDLSVAERRALAALFEFTEVWNSRFAGVDYGLHHPHGTRYDKSKPWKRASASDGLSTIARRAAIVALGAKMVQMSATPRPGNGAP